MSRMQVVLICVCLLASSMPGGRGYLLTGVRLKSDIPKLAQFAQFGKTIVLGGGNLAENNTEIFGTIVELAGGQGVARLGIINAASADPLDSFHYYRDLFMQYGVKAATRIPIDLNHTGNAFDQQTIDLIYQQTGFFFGGGDQARIIQTFLDQYGHYTPALIALHQMFDAGAVIAGTSAGNTCQTANIMIKSGVSYDALRLGSYPDVGVSNGKDDENIYASSGGIGFMKDWVLDSHFSDRGREGRMIRVLEDTQKLTKGTDYGIGVDENTALVVTHADTDNMTGKVIGVHGAAFFDVSKATVGTGTYFHISNVYNTYLTHNDVFHFRNHSVTFAPEKSPLAGHEKYADTLTTSDVFYGRSSPTRKPEFIRIAASVFDSQGARTTYGTTHERKPTFRVNMVATGHSAEGWLERKHSFHSDITSYKDLVLEIVAV